MSNEELLKHRWKVIADYPKSLYHVGDILNGGWRSEDLIYCDHDGPRWSHYPHLFRKMDWWEERTIEEMPKYLKVQNNGKVRQVKEYRWWGEDCQVEFVGGRKRNLNLTWTPCEEVEYLSNLAQLETTDK